MDTALREQMLASASDAVNTLCGWAHDQPLADFDVREERVLRVGRELLATWLGQLASAAVCAARRVRSVASTRLTRSDVGVSHAP